MSSGHSTFNGPFLAKLAFASVSKRVFMLQVHFDQRLCMRTRFEAEAQGNS